MTSDVASSGSKPKKVPLPLKLVVGACAGAFGTSCIYPIDMVKTRLQASATGTYTSPIDCFRKIVANEGGFRALYRGLGANLIGVFPEKGIKLATNEYLRERLEKDDGSIAFHDEVVAGAGAGLVQVIATNPMEITKIRMQMQAVLPVAERQTTVQVIGAMGIRGLYSGTLATLSRDIPFSVIFFPAYANMKLFFAAKDGTNSIPSLLVAGGISGALSAGAVTPTDVVKTRLQLKGGKERYGNMLNAYKTILKEEGIGALYKGAIPRMMVVGPLFAITLLSFEAQKAYMIRNGLL